LGHVHLKEYIVQSIKQLFEKSLPAVEEPNVPEEKRIWLRQCKDEVIPPPCLEMMRLQGMKRVGLKELAHENFTDYTALNIACIIKTRHSITPGTHRYYISK